MNDSVAIRAVKHLRAWLAYAATFFAMLVARPLGAADFTWDGDEFNRRFIDAHNWSPAGGPPGAADRAIYSQPGSYIVAMNDEFNANTITNRGFEVRNGIVEFSSVATDYILANPPLGIAAIVGNQAGPSATLWINGVDVDARGHLIVGMSPGSNGFLGQINNIWTSDFDATIGNSGSATLSLENSIMSNGTAVLGANPGSVGAAYLNNQFFPGQWHLDDTISIGRSGTAILNINGGMLINGGDAFIAQLPGSAATVNMDFYSTTAWNNGRDLYVGGSASGAGGNGNLNANGGVLSVADDMVVWPTGRLTIDGGEVDITDNLKVHPGGQLQLADGRLSIGPTNFLPSPGTFNWTGGELYFRSLFNVGSGLSNSPLGPSVTLAFRQELSVAGELRVGTATSGNLNITGGEVTSHSAQIGSTSSTTVEAAVTLFGDTAQWEMTGDITIGGRNTTTPTRLTIVEQAHMRSENAFVAPPNASGPLRADVFLSGAGSAWINSGSIYLGGDATTAGGSGTLTMEHSGRIEAGDELKIWDGYQVVSHSGHIDALHARIRGTLTSIVESPHSSLEIVYNLDVDGGTVTWGPSDVLTARQTRVRSGGLLTASIYADGESHVSIEGAGSTWNTAKPVTIGASGNGHNIINSLSLTPGATVNVAGSVVVVDADQFTLDGGTINATTFDMGNQSLVDKGTISAIFSTTGDVTATGDLTLGDVNSFAGVRIGGALNVGANHVTLRKRGFFTLGSSASIAGGTLSAPGGVVVAGGTGIAAFGAIDGRVAAQAGATIEASGDLALGDPNSPAGYFSDGELVVGEHAVMLLDANQAVLGSWTTLGISTAGAGPTGRPGLLTADNGLLIDFGRNLTGHGRVETVDDRNLPLINNGSIAGASATAPIELTGYVKGVGTFDNVVFNGTFAPGLSPAAVELGSVEYGPQSTLRLELGGVVAGTQYDQLRHAGNAALGGKLAIELIDGFVPSAFQSFELMTYATRSGEFSGINLPPLPAGLNWKLSYGSSSLVMAVTSTTPFLPGDIDLDGDVDRGDAALFATYFGQSTGSTWNTGDFNADGRTTLADLAIMQAHFGVEPGFSPIAATAAVPEPSACLLALVAVLGIVRKCRRERG